MKPETSAAMMFHSVGTPSPGWTWSFLTMPWQLLEGMLVHLRRMRYRTVLLDEYRRLFTTGKLEKERAVALTFDDGYLDNWVYAAPLLERYGACGTVFVSGDFIDPGEEPRPRWGEAADSPSLHSVPSGPGSSSVPLSGGGFLNKAELRILDSRKVLDVQSHCMTHTWYPCGPKIVDFRHPGDGYHWMDWNESPKTKWREIQPASRPQTWGDPVYEHQKALSGPRYFPNEDLGTALRQYAAGQGEDFFTRPGWKELLARRACELQKELPPGRRESESEFTRRMEAELTESSSLLSNLLGKTVNWLCWPGGGYCDEAFETAARYYSGTTISSGASHGKRLQGVDASGCFRFRRFGPLHAGTGASFRYLGPLANCLYIEERRTGNKPCRLLRGTLTRLAQWGIL